MINEIILTLLILLVIVIIILKTNILSYSKFNNLYDKKSNDIRLLTYNLFLTPIVSVLKMNLFQN